MLTCYVKVAGGNSHMSRFVSNRRIMRRKSYSSERIRLGFSYRHAISLSREFLLSTNSVTHTASLFLIMSFSWIQRSDTPISLFAHKRKT